MRPSFHDLERSVTPNVADQDHASLLHTKDQFPQTEEMSARTTSDKLRIYQELVGISSSLNDVGNQRSRPYRNLFFHKSSTNNKGLYKRIADEELHASIWYTFSAFLISASLILQILLAASITALGAFSGHCIAITVLGAANTVLASILAYLKGQGLPSRMLQYRNQLRRVREFLEFKERQFALGVDYQSLDPTREAEVVNKMYEAARKDLEDNYPDTYVNATEKKQMVTLGLVKAGREATSNVTAPSLSLNGAAHV